MFFVPDWVVYVLGIGGVCVGVALVVAGVTGENFCFCVFCACVYHYKIFKCASCLGKITGFLMGIVTCFLFIYFFMFLQVNLF